MNKQSFFSECNMVRMSEFEVEKFQVPIKLPFYVHIKDIPMTYNDAETTNILEYYSSNINSKKEKEGEKEKHLELLDMVDLRNFTTDSVIEEYREGMEKTSDNEWVFTNSKTLYSFLINELQFNEVDFKLMREFLIIQRIKLINAFTSFIEKELRLGEGKDDVSESFMLLRGAYESSYSGAIFSENSNAKCFSEYSYREILLQRIYFARKCEIEKAIMDEAKNKGKKKSSSLEEI